MAVQHITENSNNDVKGSFLEATSSGRVRHELQVTPDRHQATALKNKHLLKITTWNARTMNKAGKLENIKEEMNRLHINFMGISEMRWTGAGAISSENHKIIYSGGEQHERGVGIIADSKTSKALLGYWAVSDRILFYAQLDQAYSQCKSQDIIIVMGDFNAKVDNERVDNIVGPHGLGSRNERGEMLVEWAQTNNMIIGNTWFKQSPRSLWTWLSPDDHTRNQIDYILVNKRFRNSLLASKTLSGADCYSDHVPVMGRIRAKMRKLKKPTLREQLDVSLLQKDNTIKEKYAVEVKNRFSALEGLDSIEDHWKGLKVSIMDAANEVLPRVGRTTKKKWMTDEILLMERRGASKNNKEAYQHLNKQITIKCNEAKEAWLTEKCKEVEKHHNSDSRAMHKKIHEITNKKTQSSSGCLKSKTGGIIMECDKILERCSEYLIELFDDERNTECTIDLEMSGPPIMEDEVRHAVRKMKKGKAPGPDNITLEIILALDEYGINLLTSLLNKIYDTGMMPLDLLKSVFIALPKKPGATECENHLTISLMSQVTKILLKIITNRVRNKIKPEITEEQCGFVEGKGTANAIYILRNIIERSLEVQKNIYMCFKDYTKAFDKVRHDEIINILEQLHIDGKDLPACYAWFNQRVQTLLLLGIHIHHLLASRIPDRVTCRQLGVTAWIQQTQISPLPCRLCTNLSPRNIFSACPRCPDDYAQLARNCVNPEEKSSARVFKSCRDFNFVLTTSVTSLVPSCMGTYLPLDCMMLIWGPAAWIIAYLLYQRCSGLHPGEDTSAPLHSVNTTREMTITGYKPGSRLVLKIFVLIFIPIDRPVLMDCPICSRILCLNQCVNPIYLVLQLGQLHICTMFEHKSEAKDFKKVLIILRKDVMCVLKTIELSVLFLDLMVKKLV
ncbi:uncharacterized protein LOC134765810 [Penaeus indicus]|uniref:uncharacterized protein LOC134765810 n=1 Tax=Penaeus indicus TaxID=29960 RepID=UPI00300C6BDC